MRARDLATDRGVKAIASSLGLTRLLLLALAPLVACSSTPADPGAGGGGGDDDSGGSATDGGGAGDDDGGLSHGDGSTSKDGGEGGSSHDAAVPGVGPTPPPGATQCGNGTFAAGDVVSACAIPSYVLDNVPDFDGGYSSTPRACNAITTTGGAWETWCTATETYAWVRFDQVTNLGSLSDCHGITLLEIDYGSYDTGSGGGNGTQVATFQANGTSVVGTPVGTPQTATMQVTLGDNSSKGAANLFLQGTTLIGAGCPGAIVPTVLAGARVTWER